jgi:hypothetical protein
MTKILHFLIKSTCEEKPYSGRQGVSDAATKEQSDKELTKELISRVLVVYEGVEGDSTKHLSIVNTTLI